MEILLFRRIYNAAYILDFNRFSGQIVVRCNAAVASQSQHNRILSSRIDEAVSVDPKLQHRIVRHGTSVFHKHIYEDTLSLPPHINMGFISVRPADGAKVRRLFEHHFNGSERTFITVVRIKFLCRNLYCRIRISFRRNRNGIIAGNEPFQAERSVCSRFGLDIDLSEQYLRALDRIAEYILYGARNHTRFIRNKNRVDRDREILLNKFIQTDRPNVVAVTVEHYTDLGCPHGNVFDHKRSVRTRFCAQFSDLNRGSGERRAVFVLYHPADQGLRAVRLINSL